MKKIAIISFTEKGSCLAEELNKKLCTEKYEITLAKKYKKAEDLVSESLAEWTMHQFQTQDGIIFVGAAGIAVRAIAPFVKEKVQDPAVLVIDELGKYCIPLLSGHIGGANELAEIVGEKIGAIPVITTATDLNHKWAVDIFAKKNHLVISDIKRAKEISSKVLLGDVVSIYIEKHCGDVCGKMPEEVCLWKESDHKEDCCPDIAVSFHRKPEWEHTLFLIPKTVTIGIGCKKATEKEQIEKVILGVLKDSDIFLESIEKAASIDLKKEEEGILSFCEEFGLQYETYDAKTLGNVPGEFSFSSFVWEITGVDNVCERSAVCASGGGELLICKHAEDGVTVAAAARKRSIRFE